MAVLSDRSIREQVEAGRIVIEPFDEANVQPASVDVRLDRFFRVFLNHTTSVIDVKQDLSGLTEELEVPEDGVFVLHPGEFVLGSTLERVGLPEDLVARVEGKALALDTPVPTTSGWRTMGELVVGDHVFGVDGRPVPVVAVSEVAEGRRCAEVVFSDGTSVVADIHHQWWTRTKHDRRFGLWGRVSTTAQISGSLKVGREYRHHVPVAAPIQHEPRELLVDPYVLGAWIGDGTSATAVLTCADPQVLEQIRGAGYRVEALARPFQHRIGGDGTPRNGVRGSDGRFRTEGTLQSDLRALGVLGDKHIPEQYLHASIPQRQALLEGLMDTDGHADEHGRCELTTVEDQLAEQYAELVAGLGFRPVVAKRTAYLSGVDCGPKYAVTFTPDRPVFRLTRKLERQRQEARWFERSRSVRDVREVQSVPVRCIQVGATDGVFLITRRFIATHNSSLGRLGLLIHSTAGFVDPGFSGHITLELSNVANLPITLYPGMKIGQISFLTMTTPADRPYGSGALGSKYQGQRGPTPSRYWENFRREAGGEEAEA